MRHFQWSGGNTELARQQAGVRLWLYLVQLEYIGIPYTVVAHSHGGSVLWNALRHDVLWHAPRGLAGLGFRRKVVRLRVGDLQPYVESLASLPCPTGVPVFVPSLGSKAFRGLPRLRGWTTVGTPFLHLKRAHTWAFPAVLALTIAMLFAISALVAAMPRPAVLIGAGPLATIPLALLSYLGFYKNLANALTAADRAAWAAFADRATLLHSRQDEAVRGLQQSLAGRKPLVPRFGKRPSVQGPRAARWTMMDAELQFAHGVPRITAAVRRLFGAVGGAALDASLVPLIDRFLWSRIRGRALGMDLPLVRCAEVRPYPPSAVAGAAPPLDDALEGELTE